MLEKICNIVFAERKLPKFYRVTKISFFVGVILIIAFPLLSKNIKIEEKHLKNTSLFARKIGNENFKSYITSYFYENDSNDKILNFCQQIFSNSTDKPYNHIFSQDIVCPRCKKFQLIQINLIYNQALKNIDAIKKSNFIFYALMRYLSDQKNNAWLSKDIQFNYITKELFDIHPKECYERLTSAKYNKKLEEGKMIHAIYNFDLTEFDLENYEQILFKIVGINSELVDIDFYRMVLSDFQANFNADELLVTTNVPVLSRESIKMISNVLDLFGDLVTSFMPKKDYKSKYIYLIENILNNFFLINNKINTNHLLVTNGYNSLLIKTIGKAKTPKSERLGATFYKFIGTILIMIKGMSNEEVDLFRGLYFYLLTSPYQCIGYFYLFVLILMCVREFFNLIDLIYHNEFKYIWTIKNPFDKIDTKKINQNDKENNDDININNNNNNNVIYASKIIATLFFVGIFYLFLMVNIETFMNLTNIKSLENAYYYMLGNIFVNQLFILYVIKLTKAEEKFINIIMMYLNILNCWNFVFINIGVGMVLTAILMPMEFIFLHLKQIKKNLFKIAFIVFILYSVLGWKHLIRTITYNYLNYNNNVYTIITMTIILLTFRLSLFIVMLLNKLQRKESWDYDEIIDDEIEEEKDNIKNEKNDNDDKENEENNINDENEESNTNNENKENINNENEVNNINNENENNNIINENNINNENNVENTNIENKNE